MREAKKVLGLILTVLLVLGIAAGCGVPKSGTTEKQTESSVAVSAETASTKEGTDELEWKKDTSPFSFSLWTGYEWMKGTSDNLDTPVAKNITKKTGVSWKVAVPPGNSQEVLNLMIASNDLPDVLVTDIRQTQIQKMIDGGLVYSYTELIDKYCPNMWKLISKDDKLYNTKSDGKLYYVAGGSVDEEMLKTAAQKTNECFHFVRDDIYQALGKPRMGTPDEYVDTLKMVKSKYPDLIPLNFDSDKVFLLPILNGFGRPPARIMMGWMGIYQDGDNVKYEYRSPNYHSRMNILV